MSLDSTGDLVLMGGSDGRAGVYSISQRKVVNTIDGGLGSITDGLWVDERTILASSTGSITVFKKDSKVSEFTGHAGGVNAIALHPSGDLLASVGVDKSYIFYDLASSSQATQIFTDCGKYSLPFA